MVLMREEFRKLTLLLLSSVMMVGICRGQETATPQIDLSNDIRAVAQDFWNGSRAYPNQNIPAGSFVRAFAELKRNTQVSTRADIAWESMGPVNIAGRMLSIAVNPANSNTILAGSAGGGLWKSVSGGKGARAWSPVTTGFPLQAVTCITYHPVDSNIIFVGSGEVYNYQAAGTGNVVWKTRGTYGTGILMSTDGGSSWSQALDWDYGDLRGVNKIAFDPTDLNKVYAATTEGVYLSPDLGTNWFKMLNKKMVTDLVIHPDSSGWVLAAVGNLGHPDRGIYLSKDGGGTWIQSNLGVDFEGKIQLAFDPASPNTVYASVGDAQNSTTELFRSGDFGDWWFPVGSQTFTYGWFAHDVAVDPTNPDVVICAGKNIWKYQVTQGQFVQKTDYQKGFLSANAPGTPDGPADFVHENIHQIVFDPSNPSVILFATDGGIYTSEDGGQTFKNCNGGLQTAQFYAGVTSDPGDSTFFLGGLQNNGLGIYEGSSSWRRAIGGEGGYTAIDPRTGTTIFSGSSWLETSKSTNRGLSFTSVGIPAQTRLTSNFIAPFVMAPGDPDRMYFGGSKMYKSDDMGGQVVEVSNGDLDSGRKVISITVSHQDANKLYVSTSPLTQGDVGNILVQPRAKILLSTDAGETWTDINQELPDRMAMDLAVHPRDDQTLYAVLGGFGTSHVYKTTDGGASWLAVGTGLPDVPFTAIVIDPLQPKHIYVGGDLGAWVSEDSGDSWEFLTGDLGDPIMVSDLSISASNRKLRMATSGRGMMEMPMIHEAWATSISRPALAGSWDVHPNPSPNGAGIIEGVLEASDMVSIDLLAIDGRMIQQISSEQTVASGTTAFEINAENLPAGMYLIRIQSEHAIKTLRWAVQ